MTDTPLILWFRRDLRVSDQPMLAAAVSTGRPLVPLFILDPETEALGAAPKWRLGLAWEAFAKTLRGLGLEPVFRRGPALDVVRAVLADSGADAVWWSRLYDPAAVARDTAVKAALKASAVEARSFNGHLLNEPWDVQTGSGGFYRVFTPYWRAVRGREMKAPTPTVQSARRLGEPIASERLEDWRLGATMNRGAAVVGRHEAVGEAAALDKLAAFLAGPVDAYGVMRDFPAEAGTSRLSENLTYGEIGVRTIWHAGMRAMQDGRAGADGFLREIAWREFAYHLIHHSPEIATRNWRPKWDSFAWRGDNLEAERWRRGMTGEPFVDAAMREMYVTGTMHNRARMIAASYLTKHLLTDWRVGLAWFEDCLTDWDPASNAMGWQWVAGSGPDSAPFFRIFNPAGQAEKFDPDAAYRRRFVAELSVAPGPDALAFFDAVPRSWRLDPKAPYPEAVVGLAEGRARALAAYGARNS
ncbi:cryptochrome/photolyase family protein [Tabrizicola sp. BL-A-41-H6]|uniref:cryptochrome/photolyase family protein n=1 Tax=Tabrizicola sp. BL-A-41-H6 TaxID=3421107 RepID=UPI003D671283